MVLVVLFFILSFFAIAGTYLNINPYDNLIWIKAIVHFMFLTFTMMVIPFCYKKFSGKATVKNGRRVCKWNCLIVLSLYFVIDIFLMGGIYDETFQNLGANLVYTLMFYYINLKLFFNKNKVTEETIHCESEKEHIENTQKTPELDIDKMSPQEAAEYLVAKQSDEKYIPKEKQFKKIKTKFCSQCGSQIDPVTKKCTGCGKQYFKGIKFNKISAIVIVLSAVAICLVAVFIVVLVGNNDKQHSQVEQITHNVGIRTITFSDKFTAEYVLASWENGEKTEQSMIDIMDKYGAEQGGGQLYIITPGEFVEDIDEWCFSKKRKQGDFAIIENVYGFSLCYFSGKNIEDNGGLQDKDNSNTSIMIVAIEADFAPYSWSKGGDYYGLHVDIAKEIAKRTGKKVSFEVVDFHNMIAGVDSGLYDMAFGVEKTPEREKIITFTDEYYDGMCAIYHTKDEKPSFSEWTEYAKTLQDIIEDGTLKALLSKYNLS